MKPLLQQLKPNFPLYKKASLFLFLLTTALTLNAQSFYLVKGTKITIGETTTFVVTDSGKTNQVRQRDFEGQISTINDPLSETKQLVFNKKKSKLSSKRDKKQSVSKSTKKRDETYQKAKPSEFIKPFLDNFFSSYQQFVAISASVTNIKYDQKFLNENIILKPLHGYSANVNHEIINNTFLFFNNYHLSQYVTRPPPFEVYLKKSYSKHLNFKNKLR
ncbi:hypothetical protein HHL23_02740 [Chryseobacterium sp. RP-3-3]|uniref:Uncharacterized protein n=1 Tax=Chryseobacterium antibioticum TaxID=2728847 RepID=A0A7Y0FQL9_9FLAO|nr:hypothetical protein [Chryseobacterium antibioticum]NML68716.1 hypothetical protein [Chryseobacterium antibioticum]